MNAVETVYRARGWRPHTGQKHCDRWLPPNFVLACIPLPDPLADTPEGWWEFGQILEWAEGQGLRPAITLKRDMRDLQSVVYVVSWFDSSGGRTPAESVSFRAAFIEALAEAVGGTE